MELASSLPDGVVAMATPPLRQILRHRAVWYHIAGGRYPVSAPCDRWHRCVVAWRHRKHARRRRRPAWREILRLVCRPIDSGSR